MDQFPINKDSRPFLSELKYSLFTLDNWRKVYRLLNSLLADLNFKHLKQIISIVLGLMGENKILQYCVDGLTKALYNEKKKRH